MHGTLDTLQASSDYIVLAADSLIQNAAQTCKIAVLGDQIVFASSGISARTLTPTWDTYEIARRQYADLKENSQDDLIRKLAEGYGERLAEHLNRDLERSGSGELLSYIGQRNGEVGRAILAGFSGRRHQRTIAEVTVGMRVIWCPQGL